MSEIIHDQQVFSLQEVLNSIGKTLAGRYQHAYWMKAEMNKLNFYSYSGHCYPDLVEKSEGKVVAQVRAIIWNGTYQRVNQKFKTVLKEPLKDGITIMFLAKITFSAVHGLSLVIQDIDPSYSLGILEQEKQKNIEQLKNEGVYFRNKQLAMPLLPRRVAIISVETSKGYADFLKIIRYNTKGYYLSLQLFPARLQGELAVRDILKQLKEIQENSDNFDVVAIIRGGGGDVGLAAFNDFALAKKIACFPIPVLTGIGHATNETISEMVAFKNAITPTECAQFLLYYFDKAHETLQSDAIRLKNLLSKRLTFEKNLIDRLLRTLATSSRQHLTNQKTALSFQKRILIHSSTSLIEQGKENEKALTSTLLKSVSGRFKKENELLKQALTTVNLLDPQNILKRGFSITRYQGKSIGTNDALPPAGETIETLLANGFIESTIIKKSENT